MSKRAKRLKGLWDERQQEFLQPLKIPTGDLPVTGDRLMVPVLRTVPAGWPYSGSEGEISEWVYLPRIAEESIVLKVMGESPSPFVKTGDYAVLVRSEELKDGDLVAVDHGGKPLFRTFFRAEEAIWLLSWGHKQPPLRIDKQNAVAKVVEAWRPYRSR